MLTTRLPSVIVLGIIRESVRVVNNANRCSRSKMTER